MHHAITSLSAEQWKSRDHCQVHEETHINSLARQVSHLGTLYKTAYQLTTIRLHKRDKNHLQKWTGKQGLLVKCGTNLQPRYTETTQSQHWNLCCFQAVGHPWDIVTATASHWCYLLRPKAEILDRIVFSAVSIGEPGGDYRMHSSYH